MQEVGTGGTCSVGPKLAPLMAASTTAPASLRASSTAATSARSKAPPGLYLT